MTSDLPIVARLNVELAELRHEMHKELPKQIAEARAHGDLKENAEYHAAKERQGMLNARIGTIEQRLAELSMYSLASIPKDRAGYGSRLVVEDLDSGDEITYELAFSEEADPDKGQISMNSPAGQAFLAKHVGDEIVVQTPSGKRTYELLEVTTIHVILSEEGIS
jgi:transcription elongation factor GreA